MGMGAPAGSRKERGAEPGTARRGPRQGAQRNSTRPTPLAGRGPSAASFGYKGRLPGPGWRFLYEAARLTRVSGCQWPTIGPRACSASSVTDVRPATAAAAADQCSQGAGCCTTMERAENCNHPGHGPCSPLSMNPALASTGPAGRWARLASARRGRSMAATARTVSSLPARQPGRGVVSRRVAGPRRGLLPTHIVSDNEQAA
jgi:hypothetical protein